MRRVGLVAVVVLLGTTLVACGDDEVCSTPDGAGCSPDPDPFGGTHNDADETYVEIRGGGLGSVSSMAHLAIVTSDSSEITAVASDIVDELDEVLDRFDTLEDDWDLPVVVHGSAMDPSQQVQDPDRARLSELEGEEFDALWVELVLESLDSAESSAETVIERGANAGLREIAEDALSDVGRWIDTVEAIGD